MKAGVEAGKARIQAFLAEHVNDPTTSGKIFGTRAFLTNSATQHFGLDKPDLLRAAGAQAGLYGNSALEALYPTYFTDADGEPLDASKHSYTLTFAADALPPVKAFWSLSMYDGKTQLFIENRLDRYLLNSAMLDEFERGEDGSLTLYIGSEAPDDGLEANWLPAPEGPFYLVMRLYGPEDSALDGRWVPPQVKKAGE